MKRRYAAALSACLISLQVFLCAASGEAAAQDVLADETKLAQGEAALLDAAREACAESGIPFPGQEECMEQIHFALDYLSEKYERKFSITSYALSDQDLQTAEMCFSEEDGQHVYDLQLWDSGNGYVAKDNFYGSILREDYDNRLQSWIQTDSSTYCLTHTTFHSLLGNEVSSDTITDRLFSMRDRLDRHTDIFVSQPNESFEPFIQAFVRKHGLYGFYRIYNLDSFSDIGSAEDAYGTMAEIPESVISTSSFQNYDI